MAHNRSILIIGAGIGGLSTGCYARMNGYEARIFEMHHRPGGVCTGWRRDGYLFDGCLHNLGGTDAGSPLHRMWGELGAARLRMHGFKEQVAVERPGGEPLVLETDLARLADHLKSLSPTDGREIDRLIAGARFFADFDLMGLALASRGERMSAFLLMLPLALRYGSTTLDTYAKRFKDPFLRDAIPKLIYDWPKQSVIMMLYFLGRLSVGDLGWVEGGSAALADSLATRFEELGGSIRYGERVQSIIVEHGRAVGVRLADGTEARADIVVSNADGHTTIFDMLHGRYVSDRQRRYYSRPEDRVEMGLHVSIGVGLDLADEPHSIVLPLDEPIEIAGEVRDRLFVQIFNYDRSFAPAGKTAVKVLLGTDFSYWEEMARDWVRYRVAKERVAAAVIGPLSRRFPGFAQAVEVIDVATPVTTLNFAGSGHGYKDGMTNIMSSVFLGRRPGRILPGLSCFYQVGQWAGVPGVPFVAADGRDLVRAICLEDGRTFQTEMPAPAPAMRPSLAAAA